MKPAPNADLIAATLGAALLGAGCSDPFLGGRASELVVSAETTHVVEPLREDGTVNHPAALNDSLGEDVAWDENAAAILVPVLNTSDGDRRVALRQLLASSLFLRNAWADRTAAAVQAQRQLAQVALALGARREGGAVLPSDLRGLGEGPDGPLHAERRYGHRFAYRPGAEGFTYAAVPEAVWVPEEYRSETTLPSFCIDAFGVLVRHEVGGEPPVEAGRCGAPAS